MSILDEMRNEQQETEPSSTASNLSEPTNADVIAAVNRQTKAVNGLKSYLRFAIEETVKEELKALPSTSQPSVNRSSQIESVESRLSEIESTLRVFAQSLDGKQLQSASQSLIAEAQMNRAATASATEKLQSLAEDNQKLVSQVGGAVQRIDKRTEERVEKAVEQVAGEASATMTANLDASNERAERIMQATAKLEARQLWSAAAAMCLALLPVVVVVAGVWMGIAGIITGAQWALDVDGSVWLGIGRWIVVAVGLAGAGYGLFASVRWAARPRGDLEGPRDAEVAELAEEVTAIPEGKRAERVRQATRLANSLVSRTQLCDDNCMQNNPETLIRPSKGEGEYPELVRKFGAAPYAQLTISSKRRTLGESEDNLASMYFPAVALIVAERDGAPVGFAGVAEGNLEMLFVTNEVRGGGVGTLLLREAISASA